VRSIENPVGRVGAHEAKGPGGFEKTRSLPEVREGHDLKKLKEDQGQSWKKKKAPARNIHQKKKSPGQEKAS